MASESKMIGRWIDELARNVRYAVRALVRAPGLTVTAVLTLAIGIGANSAVFSVIDAVLLEPLPFPDADRLVQVRQVERDVQEQPIAPVRLEDWNRLGESLEALSGYYTSDFAETTGDVPERLRVANVAPRFLDVLEIVPALGRAFNEADHRFGGTTALLISDSYWRNRFGADPRVLGTAIGSGEQTATVVGVMPASFAFPESAVAAWAALPVDAPYAQSRQAGWYTGIGRLAPGVTLEQARSELAAVQSRLAEQYPESDTDVSARIVPLKETVVGDVRASLWLLFGAVSILLVIACTNIAALLLSRAAQRAHEIAIRYSLGASRPAVALQTLSEALVLALAGAAAGLLVASGASAALRTLAPELPRLGNVTLDARIMLYTLAPALVAALLCGLTPALRSARGVSLAGAGRTQTAPRHSLQWGLVGVQVALSVTLLAGAGLLVRSLDGLGRVDPGFDAARVLTFRTTGGYDEGLMQRVNATIDAVAGSPGIEASATALHLPGVPTDVPVEYELVEGRADTAPPIIAERRTVSPGYFEALQIPLVAGELCDRPETQDITEVMVNQRFVDRYLPGRSPVGLHLDAGSPDRIVGVVGNARDTGTNRAPVPTVYPCMSAPVANPWFLVRTAGEPLAAAGTVRATLARLDPLRAVYDFAPLQERIGNAYAQERLRTILLGSFAVTALLLACIGVHGTLSYAVSLRRREVGLRAALGARQRHLVAQFVRKALRVVGVACVAGLGLSFALTRVLSGMLYGVSPTDPVTLTAVVATVLAVAVVAAWFPARRAARIDPMQALRED